jgi:hypothetical protein
MELLYNYNHTAPSDTLTYDLFDYNITGYTRVDNNLPSNSIIPQGKDNFAKAMEGSINMDLGYNYTRTYNTEVNPRSISMNDFNISYRIQPTSLYVEGRNNHEIFGNLDIDQNVTFVYGRAKPGKYFYDDITANSILTPISVTVYCDLGYTQCQNRGIPALLAQTNEFSWWNSVDHDNVTSITGKDGNIVLSIPTTGSFTNGTTQTNIVNINTNGTNNTVTVFYKNGTKPITIPIYFMTFGTAGAANTDPTNYTDRWLIYNKDINAIPSPFYRVRFISTGTWSTTGNLPGVGNVVGDNVNKKKSNRVEW